MLPSRHGGLGDEWIAGIAQAGGIVDQQTCRFHLHGDLRDLELHSLKLGDRFAKFLSLLCISNGSLVGALGDADGQCSDRDAAAVEDLHRLDESFTFVAKAIFIRNVTVFENNG